MKPDLPSNSFNFKYLLFLSFLLFEFESRAQFYLPDFQINPAESSVYSIGVNFGALSQKNHLLLESQSLLFPVEASKIKLTGIKLLKNKTSNLRASIGFSKFAEIPSQSFVIAYAQAFNKLHLAGALQYDKTRLSDYYGSYHSLISRIQIGWTFKKSRLALSYSLEKSLNLSSHNSSEWQIGIYRKIGSGLFFGFWTHIRPKEGFSLFYTNIQKEIKERLCLELRANQTGEMLIGASFRMNKWQARLFLQYTPYLSLQHYAAASHSN